jgi:hypothetical protein
MPEERFIDKVAYLGYRGWAALVHHADHTISALQLIQDQLRDEKRYDISDRLRKISADLKGSADYVRSDLIRVPTGKEDQMTQTNEDYAHVADEATRAQLTMTDAEWLAQDDLDTIALSLTSAAMAENEADDAADILDKTIVDARGACAGAAFMHCLAGFHRGVITNLRLYYAI